MSSTSHKRKRVDEISSGFIEFLRTNKQARSNIKDIIDSLEQEEEGTDAMDVDGGETSSAVSTPVKSKFETLPLELRTQIYCHLGLSTESHELALTHNGRLREDPNWGPLQTMSFRHHVRAFKNKLVIKTYGADGCEASRDEVEALQALTGTCHMFRSDIVALLIKDSVFDLVMPSGCQVKSIDPVVAPLKQWAPLISPATLALFNAIAISFDETDLDGYRGYGLADDIMSALYYLEGRVPSMTRLIIKFPAISPGHQYIAAYLGGRATGEHAELNRQAEIAEGGVTAAINRHLGHLQEVIWYGEDMTPATPVRVGPERQLRHLQDSLHDWMWEGSGKEYGEWQDVKAMWRVSICEVA